MYQNHTLPWDDDKFDFTYLVSCSRSGGSLLHPGASYPFSPLLQGGRHPAPASFAPYPPQLLYWPYPSPPMSPNNYFLPSHPTTLLTPTSSISSISSLSNGVTSPPPTLQGSPVPLSSQPPVSSLVKNLQDTKLKDWVSVNLWMKIYLYPQLTVETAPHLQRGATERPPDSLLRPSIYIH